MVEDIKSGKINMDDVNRNVKRMLEYIVRTPHFKGYKFSDKPDMKAHAAITRQSSTEGMVLLKNAGALPLKQVDKVALFGVNSYDFMSGGLGSGCVNVPYVVDMVTGLKNANISTTPQLTEIYQSYVKYAKAKLKADKNPEMWFLDQGQPKLDEIDITSRCIQHELPEADAAIITIGRQAGEGIDRSIDGEFNLSKQEQDMIFRVSDAFHAANKPVIVVINSGSVMETASWRDRADAILVAWQPGEEGGNSIADVLTGKSNPSGHLTMTWPIAATDHPSTKNFPQTPDYYNLTDKLYNNSMSGVNYTNHDEGIYVGYRYFDTNKKTVAYPFGFGLSYTTFDMNNVKCSEKKNEIEVSVTVKNTGKVSGKQVAQIYVAAPKGAYDKPAKELKAFAKTRELRPGESETLSVSIPRRLLTSFDETHSQWLGDAGTYTFMVGDNVEHIFGSADLKLAAYTEKVSNALPKK
jgi:beta-glucosidase